MNKKIVWEKWEDEFSIEKTNTQEDSYNDTVPIKFEIDSQIPIRTPLGIFTKHDPMLPSKMFECWIGHTNFDLKYKEKKILCDVPGIEVLKILTRYRFFIGIGRQFSFREVRKELNKRLCGCYSQQDIEDDAIFDTMSKTKAKRWAVFIKNDGTTEVALSNEDYDPEFENRISNFEKRRDGRLVTDHQMVYYKKGSDFY